MRAFIHGFRGKPYNTDCRIAADGFQKLGVETVLCTTNEEFDMRNPECVVLLSQRRATEHIDIKLDLTNLDLTAAEAKPAYDDIKAYVLKTYGLKVSTLYISQVKRKLGLEVGKSFNKPKTNIAKQPQCPPDKEKIIIAALKYFNMTE